MWSRCDLGDQNGQGDQSARVVRVVQVVQAFPVIQVVSVLSVVRMISLYDIQSQNIWFSWSKPSNYREKLRCHACDGQTKEEQYSGRPETAKKHYVSLLCCFWGGIKDYDDDCADIEIRQFCGCQPASIWLNGFYITTSSSSSFHPPPTHIPTFCRRMAKFNITLAGIADLLDLWKWTVTLLVLNL